MPQFDIATFGAQFFWLMILFGTLWGCMHFWIVPQMRDIFAKRWEKTGGKIEKSHSLLSKAEHLGKEYQEIIQQARQDALNLQKETQKKLYLDLLREKNRINNQIIFKIKAEKKRIEKEKKSFFQEVENISTDLSLTMVNKIHQFLKTKGNLD